MSSTQHTSIHNIKIEVKRLIDCVNYYTAKSKQYKHQCGQLLQKHKQQKQQQKQQQQQQQQQQQLLLEQQMKEIKELKEALRAQKIEYENEMETQVQVHDHIFSLLNTSLKEERNKNMALKLANDILELQVEITSAASTLSPPSPSPSIRPVSPLRFKTPSPPQPQLVYEPTPKFVFPPSPPILYSPPQPTPPQQQNLSTPPQQIRYYFVSPPTPSRPPPPLATVSKQPKVGGHKRDTIVACTKKLSKYFKKSFPNASNITTEQGNGKVRLVESKDGESSHSDPWYMSPLIKESRDVPRWWGKLKKKD